DGLAGEEAAHAVHLAGDTLELREHRAYRFAVLIELGVAGVGDAIKLLVAFGFDRGVTELFKVGQRRIDHAGTRRVEATGPFGQLLDQVVAMARLFFEQRQNEHLQLAAAELAPGADAARTEAHPFLDPPAEPAMAVTMAHEAPPAGTETHTFVMHLGTPYSRTTYRTIYL